MLGLKKVDTSPANGKTSGPQVRTCTMSNPSMNPRFCCPVSLNLMTEPCTTPCGHTFDRSTLQQLVVPSASYSYYGGGQILDVHCPTCRAVFPRSWSPVVNYDLKGIIEDAVAAFQGPAPAAAAVAVPVQAVVAQVTPTITAKFTDDRKNTIHIQVSVPADATPLPLNVIAVVDMSGSMGSRATEPKPVVAGQAAEESSLMSRMDLTGHSVKALAKTLKPCDCLSIIGFDTEAVTYLPPTAMDAAGQDLAVAKVSQIKPRGGTAFWSGISAAFKALEASAAVNPGANNVIIFQTDGESDPTYDPPQGLLKTLDAWKDRHADIKFTLHTIGYGYGNSLQSYLLREIAKKCGGDFYYVPDGSVLAQVAIHLFANLGAITHTDVSLHLHGYERAYLPVGFLQAGQARDFILGGQVSSVARLFVKGTEVESAHVSDPDGSTANALARNIFVDRLSTALACFIPEHLNVDSLKRELNALPATPYITALLTDLTHADMYKGQISKGFISENFHKWGKHYLPGVLSGHCNQWPMNFKDECSTFYETSVTKNAIQKGVEIYEALPPIKASFTASGSGSGAQSVAYVAPQVASSGGCFTGDTVVITAYGGRRRLDELRPGEILMNPFTGEKKSVVRCVVRYDVTAPQRIVRFGNAGLTEYHPVMTYYGTLAGPSTPVGDWSWPRSIHKPMLETVKSVYNVVLEPDSCHCIALCQDSGDPNCDWVIACTLAHNFEGPVISHSYFGAPQKDKPHCLDDLKMANGWDTGYVICKNTREERNDDNEIVRLIFDSV